MLEKNQSEFIHMPSCTTQANIEESTSDTEIVTDMDIVDHDLLAGR